MSEGAVWQSPGHKTKVYGSKMGDLRTASTAWRVGAICYQQQITNTSFFGEKKFSVSKCFLLTSVEEKNMAHGF